MKTLGLIGGLSWYSTLVYYRAINQLVNQRLGGSHSAKLILYSVDFEEFRVLQERDDWAAITSMLTRTAQMLQDSGADCIVMCTNTPHLVADDVREQLRIPLLHIAEETAKAISRKDIRKVGLIGTKFTMENSFFTDRLKQFGIDATVPDIRDRDYIHHAIFNELTKGTFKETTRSEFLTIINKLQDAGVEGVIFGCTEFGLLIKPEECSLPIFDTAFIHAAAAVDFALAVEQKEGLAV